MLRYWESGLMSTAVRDLEPSGICDATVKHVSAESASPAQKDQDLTKLDDPKFFRHWSELRRRIALSGKKVPDDLKREYDAVSAEYRRRVNGGQNSDGEPGSDR
jgi:hypothetical protein